MNRINTTIVVAAFLLATNLQREVNACHLRRLCIVRSTSIRCCVVHNPTVACDAVENKNRRSSKLPEAVDRIASIKNNRSPIDGAWRLDDWTNFELTVESEWVFTKKALGVWEGGKLDWYGSFVLGSDGANNTIDIHYRLVGSEDIELIMLGIWKVEGDLLKMNFNSAAVVGEAYQPTRPKDWETNRYTAILTFTKVD